MIEPDNLSSQLAQVEDSMRATEGVGGSGRASGHCDGPPSVVVDGRKRRWPRTRPVHAPHPPTVVSVEEEPQEVVQIHSGAKACTEPATEASHEASTVEER